MISALLRRFGLAFWVGLKGALFSASAILAFGLSGLGHAILFEQPLEAPLEMIFLGQALAGLIMTVTVDIFLIPWTILLSLALYGRHLKYWTSWLLTMSASVPPLLFMVYLSSFANTAAQEITLRPISWVEKAYILFTFASWFVPLTSSFAWAFFRSHRKFMGSVSR